MGAAYWRKQATEFETQLTDNVKELDQHRVCLGMLVQKYNIPQVGTFPSQSPIVSEDHPADGRIDLMPYLSKSEISILDDSNIDPRLLGKLDETDDHPRDELDGDVGATPIKSILDDDKRDIKPLRRTKRIKREKK